MPRLRYYTAAIAVLTALGASPSSAEPLVDTVRNVLNAHPQVEGAKVDLGISKQDIKEQSSAYFPEVSISATGGRIYGDNATSRGLSTTRGSGYSYLWEGSITGRQKIFDAFETRNKVRSAEALKQSARFNLTDLREELAFRSAQAHINLMRARNGLAMVGHYKAKIDEYLGRIKALVDEGAADETELQQARDVSVIIKNFALDYEGQLKAAEAEYYELVGHVPEEEMSVSQLSGDVLPTNMQAAIRSAKDMHVRLMSARKEIEAAKYGVRAEQSNYYPDIDGELSYLKSDKEDVIGGEVVDGRAVLKLNWNLETGGAQAARIKKKRLERESAKARLRDTERQIERGVRIAFSQYETAAKQLENQRERQDLNEKLFATYETQFEGAVVSMLQLMQADNQLFTARLETMNAQYNYVLSQYAVLASMGVLQKTLGLASETSI